MFINNTYYAYAKCNEGIIKIVLNLMGNCDLKIILLFFLYEENEKNVRTMSMKLGIDVATSMTAKFS